MTHHHTPTELGPLDVRCPTCRAPKRRPCRGQGGGDLPVELGHTSLTAQACDISFWRSLSR